MVRPCASKENRLLCLQFAQACTKNTANATDLLARCGPLSPFAALAQCCPSAVRIENQGRRDGISELECNKVLQSGGFQMIRDRRATARNKNEDPAGSGLYLYIEVQWRDPDTSEDLCQLMHAWNTLRSNFPGFAAECSLDAFLNVIRSINSAWKPKNSRKDVRVRSIKRNHEAFEFHDPCVAISDAPLIKRQDSQVSLASTILDARDTSSPATVCSSRSCSWVDEGLELPVKRQCTEYVEGTSSRQVDFKEEWWAPENLSRSGVLQQALGYWDVSAWPNLAEDKEVADEVVISLLQHKNTAM